MAIIQISKIQQRSGNIVDLPQLDEAEFGWATDAKKLYIGKTSPNENIEVLTSYSNINFSQIEGSFGNLNIQSANLENGQVLAYTGTEWTNKGGNAGGLVDLGDVSNVKINGGAVSYVLETDGTGNLSWTPKSTIIAYIQNITKANPCVVTTAANNYFVDHSEMTITNVPGMTELNGNSYYANVLSANTFELYYDYAFTVPVDTTAYNTFPYTSVTATSQDGNITVGNSALFSANDPIKFVGTTFGGIESNTTYYVLTTPTGTTLTVSETLGGNTFIPNNDSGSCNVYTEGGRAISLVVGGTGNAGVAGGSNTMIQFNNNNVLDGSPNLTFDFGTKILTVTGNANVGNLNATGIITATRLVSNVSTGTAPLTVSSATRVANLNVANANMADYAGNVTASSQSNITSLGTLTTLNVNARVNATGYTSNVATGTAPFTVSSTTRVANLNVAYANVSDYSVVTSQTTGTYYPTLINSSATANYAFGANANLAFNIATGNLQTNILYANINVFSAGNVTGVNLVANASMYSNQHIFANRFIKTPYRVVEPTTILNAGTGALSTNVLSSTSTGTNPYGVTVDPSGRFVYVSNQSAGTVSQYSINQTTGALTSITIAISAGATAYAPVVDPTGRFVYVPSYGTNTISQYSINQTTGALLSVASPISTDSSPLTIAIDPTGRFLYVTNYTNNSVNQFSINQTTGALSSIASAVSTNVNPYGIAVDPTGRFVFVTNYSTSTINTYSINQTTGQLSSINSPIATGTNPKAIVIDSSGRFVYVLNYTANSISQYSINQTTGVLTSITSAIAISPGSDSSGLIIDTTGRFVYVSSIIGDVIARYSINQATGELASLGSVSATDAIGIAIDPTGRFFYAVNYSSDIVNLYSVNSLSTGAVTVASGVASTSTSTGALTVTGGVGIGGNIYIGGLINVNNITTGSNVTVGSMTGNWSLTAGSKLNAALADLAEYYEADSIYEAGTVLEFGGDKEVTLASVGSTRVAGVVSTDPAYAMNAKCPGIATAIALQGRVPVKVRGKICKGDMMVSGGDGYAVATNTPVLGSIIGKSLENFEGEGVIEIAVGRL